MRKVVYAAQAPLNGTIPYGGVRTKIKKKSRAGVIRKRGLVIEPQTKKKPRVFLP